jgi:hypothetical protein
MCNTAKLEDFMAINFGINLIIEVHSLRKLIPDLQHNFTTSFLNDDLLLWKSRVVSPDELCNFFLPQK